MLRNNMICPTLNLALPILSCDTEGVCKKCALSSTLAYTWKQKIKRNVIDNNKYLLLCVPILICTHLCGQAYRPWHERPQNTMLRYQIIAIKINPFCINPAMFSYSEYPVNLKLWLKSHIFFVFLRESSIIYEDPQTSYHPVFPPFSQ